MRCCETCGWYRHLAGGWGFYGGQPEEERCLVIEELTGDYTDEEREQAEEHWNGTRINCPCYASSPEN
jgi:hypothetical protein